MSKLVSVLKKVEVVREQLDAMCIGKQGPALRVMDLAYVISEVYKLQIEMVVVDFRADHLKGNLERYSDGRARVLVRADLNDAEKRLVAVKELCHLFIDEKDDWSADGTATIDAYLKMESAVGEGEDRPIAGNTIHSELMAMLAATELMYPQEYREADALKMAEEGATLSSIALEHEIPAYVIRHAITNKVTLDHAREMLGEERKAA
ncbi:hypothetical protein [Sphingomonas sp. Ant20]|uniref:hypothetical protein n=1 Tax=Sphingomonas sp. Ant20 TaxID=104605 RepID=UPI000FE140C1|nr:hypothetical protein [Sphingomonas sp. Ant20]